MDPLAVIYNENQWRISRVSPLFNIQYNEVKFKQYAAKIKHSLVSAVSANAAIKFSVQVEDLPLLKYSENDSNGIMITVNSTQELKTKVAYNAILLSWGTNVTLNCATHLPYMLERGEQKIGQAVKNSVQNIFDCNIKEYNFTQFQLLQIGFNFLENDTSRGTDPFTLVYRTPQIDFRDKISMTFEVADMQTIWNSIKGDVCKDSEVITLAYQNLQNQIFYMLMIDITVFDICEVILPKAEVKSNGIVKMKTPETINAFFTVLNTITDSFNFNCV